MSWKRSVARFLAFTRNRRYESELEAEIQAHLEMAEQEGVAGGIPAGQARAEAVRRFGGIEQIKEQHRDRRGIRPLDDLRRDIRYGFGSLRRDPGFAALVVAVLALGIGANVAMFSLVDGVLLKPLPFADADRMVRIFEAPRPGTNNATSTLDFLDWRRLGTGFDAMAAEIPIAAALTGFGEPVRLTGKAVTADYFRVFTVTPKLGRTFRADEDQPGAEPVVVLSHAAWETYFSGDSGILERRILLDGVPHRVAGVLRPGVFDRDEAEFWKPLVFAPANMIRDWHWLLVHARLRPGVTLERARAQIAAVRAAAEGTMPVWKRPWKLQVAPLSQLLVGDRLRQSIVVAFGAVVLVLLIACANVVNLLLAKGMARRKEMTIRAALGASRGRLAAQLLTESLPLCLLGWAAGLCIASLMIRGAGPFLERSLPYTAALALDVRAFLFASALVVPVALLIGALPALQVSRHQPARALAQASRSSTARNQTIRRSIVVGEVALSMVLLCGALLLMRSLFNLQRLETGVRIDNIVTLSLDLSERSYPTPEKAAWLYQSLTERLKSIPGIREVGLTTHLPLQWIGNGESIEVPGVKQTINVRFKRVDPGYFRTLDIPVLAGRGLSDRDRQGRTTAVVINETAAQRLRDAAGIENPVGRTVRINCPHYIAKGGEERPAEIVGIIRSERVAAPGTPDPPVVYVPLAQVPTTRIRAIVRSSNSTGAVAAIREAVRQTDAKLPIGDVLTLQEVRDRTLSGARQPAWIIGAFAGMAVLLAAIGLYGVLAQTVAQQRREIGIRMALGAQASDVVSQFLRNALVLVLSGLALGAAGAIGMTRVLKNLLFQVSPLDPLAMVLASTALLAIGLAAGLVPATRAAAVDPVVTLRNE